MGRYEELYKRLKQSRQNKMNEENLNEMTRDEEKSAIKKARPVIQKIAYKYKVNVKNPGQNTNRFILVGEKSSEAAKEAVGVVKEVLKELEGFEDLRIRAAGVASKDKEKYNIEGPCKAVIVDAPGSSNEELNESTVNAGDGKKASGPDNSYEGYTAHCKEDSSVTEVWYKGKKVGEIPSPGDLEEYVELKKEGIL